MMGSFKKEWDALFLEILEDYADSEALLNGKILLSVMGIYSWEEFYIVGKNLSLIMF